MGIVIVNTPFSSLAKDVLDSISFVSLNFLSEKQLKSMLFLSSIRQLIVSDLLSIFISKSFSSNEGARHVNIILPSCSYSL